MPKETTKIKRSPMELQTYLLERAGIDNKTMLKGVEDVEFEHVLQAFSGIHRGKEYLYGNYAETHCKEPKLFALITYFADIKRKFVRLENIIKKMSKGEDIALEELFDTLSDLGVYSAMGVQVINNYDKQEVPDDQI